MPKKPSSKLDVRHVKHKLQSSASRVAQTARKASRVPSRVGRKLTRGTKRDHSDIIEHKSKSEHTAKSKAAATDANSIRIFKRNIPRRYIPAIAIVIVSMAIYIVAGGLWWQKVYLDPQRTFNGMLSRSLSTPAVMKAVDQKGDGNFTEKVQYDFAKDPQVKLDINQTDSQKNSIKVEAIGTTKDSYNRFVKLTQNTPDGKKADVSKVVNVWAKDAVVAQTGTLNESLQSLIVFGNLKDSDRSKIIRGFQNKKVYTIDFKKVSKKGQQLTYKGELDINAYLVVYQDYAKAMGLSVDEAASKNNAPGGKLPFSITVDAFTRHLKSVKYEDGSNRTESYSDYDVRPEIVLPTKTITGDELRSQLNQALSGGQAAPQQAPQQSPPPEAQ